MKKLRCTEIDWDTTDDEHPEGQNPDGLPTQVIIEVDDNFDIEQEAADYLSDKYGFCIRSVSVEEVRLTDFPINQYDVDAVVAKDVVIASKQGLTPAGIGSWVADTLYENPCEPNITFRVKEHKH